MRRREEQASIVGEEQVLELAVNQVRRPAVVGHLLRRLRHREGELVQVGHRRHGVTVPCDERAAYDGPLIGSDA
jgi:hypothetical protein